MTESAAHGGGLPDGSLIVLVTGATSGIGSTPPGNSPRAVPP